MVVVTGGNNGRGLRRAVEILGGYRKRRRGIRASAEGGSEPVQRIVPVSQRKDALLFRPGRTPILLLLRLRRGRRRAEVRNDDRRRQLLRGAEIAGGALWHSHAETQRLRRREHAPARRDLPDARGGGADVSQQPRLCRRRGGARL